MKHRIRAGAIVIHDNRLLLVEHTNETGYKWWTVPGGGIEGSESVYDCVVREVNEEVNLVAKPGNILAIRQYISQDHMMNQIEFFIRCSVDSIEANRNNLAGKNDEQSLTEIRWISLKDLHAYNIFPTQLKKLNLEQEGIIFLGPDYDYE